MRMTLNTHIYRYNKCKNKLLLEFRKHNHKYLSYLRCAFCKKVIYFKKRLKNGTH